MSDVQIHLYDIVVRYKDRWARKRSVIVAFGTRTTLSEAVQRGLKEAVEGTIISIHVKPVETA